MSKQYEAITNELIEKIETEGILPWEKPWNDAYGLPRNLDGKVYRGVNLLLLAFSPFKSGTWGTYKAFKAAGGQVQKGQKGTSIVFWKLLEKEGTDEKIPLLRRYTVFNVEQTDLADPFAVEVGDMRPIDKAIKIWDNYPCKPEGKHGNQAFYRPADDTLTMPSFGSFVSPEAYHSTLFHEAIHSTGHRKRLNREGVTNIEKYNRHKTGIEECIAEFGASYLRGVAGIETNHEKNQSAAYIQGWAKAFKNDPKLIIQAASAGQKAADHILGTSWDK